MVFNDRQNVVDVMLGENVIIRDFVNLYGCEIGDDTKIGTFVEIQRGVSIGKRCKIGSHTFICEGVHIGDGVFVGHNVSFINDKNPRAVDSKGELITDGWQMVETVIADHVSVGTGATIMGGITIGESAVIGAGAVVVKDVPENTTVVGNPAHVIQRG